MEDKKETSRDVLDVIYRRRSVRSYTGRKVDAATLQSLLKAAVQAPTAIHSEPWAFVVLQDAALLERLSQRAKELQLASLPNDPKAASYRELLASPAFDIFYQAGTLIVICSTASNPYVAADCWLAAENLMLAACAQGLGTCTIGFAIPALNTAEVKAELSIPEGATAVAPIIVGFPSGVTPPVSRKEPQILLWK